VIEEPAEGRRAKVLTKLVSSFSTELHRGRPVAVLPLEGGNERAQT
jgi:hypothetical protein